MAGVRVGGIGVASTCSPPWTAYGGSATAGDPQVWAACSSDAPGEATQYTNFSGLSYDQCSNPVISPDGTKILFEADNASTGFSEVWVVDAVAGSTPTQVVADASNYIMHPGWAPDSDTFVYVHGAGGNREGGTIYKDTVSSPGTPVSLKAAAGGSSPFRPQFNFDGTRIAYVFDVDVPGSGADLRCMDADGTNDASLDNTLNGYQVTNPPQFAWASTQNLVAYADGFGLANALYVIDDAGAGKTQINANGDAAGVNAVLSGRAWPIDDSFIVITAAISPGLYSIVRAEVDGSTTTELSTTLRAVDANTFRGALVYQGRIWFVTSTDSSASHGAVGSMKLDGTDERTDFDSSLGSGTAVAAFVGGDGWYFE